MDTLDTERITLLSALALATAILWRHSSAAVAARLSDLTARITLAESRLDECERDRAELRHALAHGLQQVRRHEPPAQ